MTTSYTEVFGGTNIYPSNVSYLEFPLTTTDVVLSWPVETNATADGTLPTARIMDVACTTVGRKVYMPPADQAGVGECALFNNIGSQTFTVVGSTGATLCTVQSGTLWQVYMTDNTSAAGSWVSYQFGSSTSYATAALLAGQGLKAIGATLNQAITTTTINSNFTLGAGERAELINWTGASGTISLTGASTLGADWFCYIRNSGSSNITIDPNLSELINGSTTLTLAPFDSCMVICNGTEFYTIGLSSSSTTGFNYTSFSIAGTGDYTLATNQQNKIAYNLTGILTGNRNVIVPTTVQQYWITNATTGSYTVTVKTSAGTGIVVAQGTAQILYCDGTNVVLGQTGASVSLPLAISSGGTGATTAGGALVNLGGGSAGISVFGAVTPADARSTLNVFSADETISLIVALG